MDGNLPAKNATTMRTPIKHTKSFRQLTKISGRALVVICVISPAFSAGCRSGKSPMNLFGSRAEPSAEMLAGSGPTTTYPAPPSSKATPEAIASIAGGTAPQAPSMPTTPSMNPPTMPPSGANPYALAGSKTAPPAYALPGSNQQVSTAPGVGSPVPQSPSYAAAGANGYAASGSPVSTNPQTAATPPTTTARPSGYNLAGTTSSTSSPTSQSKPNSSFVMPPLNSLTPSQTAASSTSTPGSSSSSYASGGGFTLPTGIVPAQSAVSAPPSPPQTAVASLDLPPSNSQTSPGLSTPLPSTPSPAPEYQTASSSTASVRPSALGGASSQESTVRPTGYMPGSTGAASGYPGATPMIR